MTEKLAVLDFSGTLSLSAPRFAAPDVLRKELEKSGLAALGVTPGLFWAELVNPTWTEGSTTRAGYRRILAERLAALKPQASREGIDRAVSRFSDSYFKANAVDPLWTAFLRTCVRQAGLAAVIATDHYAEATGAILNSLAGLGIPARSVAESAPPSPRQAIRVANSADLGAHKSSLPFWNAVRRALGCEECKGVLLVDDFGINEPEGDAYGEREKIDRRRAETTARLGEAFQAPVACFFFSLRPATADPAGNPAAARIAGALEALERFLAS